MAQAPTLENSKLFFNFSLKAIFRNSCSIRLYACFNDIIILSLKLIMNLFVLNASRKYRYNNKFAYWDNLSPPCPSKIEKNIPLVFNSVIFWIKNVSSQGLFEPNCAPNAKSLYLLIIVNWDNNKN